MRRKILPFILGGALSVAAVVPVAAAPPTTLTGGAVGLVNVIVQAVVQNVAVLSDNNFDDVINVEVNDSLNNLLRGANIQVLQDFLNNSLNNLDLDVIITDIRVVDGDIIVTVLGGDVIALR